jgi:DNA invertase Pin-like site-specific DNA recombinase
LTEAQRLVGSIRSKGARLAEPGLVDLSEFATEADGVARIVLESVQELLLKLALQMARDDYETRRERQRQGVQLAKAAGKYAGRIPDAATHQRIIALRGAGQSIKRTAKLAGCSESQVKRVWAIHLNQAPGD